MMKSADHLGLNPSPHHSTSQPTPSLLQLGILGYGHLAQVLLTGYKLQYPQDPPLISIYGRERTLKTAQPPPPDLTSLDLLLLAIKPQQLSELRTDLFSSIEKKREGPVLLSVLAGTLPQNLQTHFQNLPPCICAMPNLCAAIGESATGIYVQAGVSSKQEQKALDFLSASGPVVLLQKATDLFIVTALSGSGPAYWWTLMDAVLELKPQGLSQAIPPDQLSLFFEIAALSFADAAQSLGLSLHASMTLLLQTMKGSARYLLMKPQALKPLIEQVTSKNGTTAAARSAFEVAHLYHIVETLFYKKQPFHDQVRFSDMASLSEKIAQTLLDTAQRLSSHPKPYALLKEEVSSFITGPALALYEVMQTGFFAAQTRSLALSHTSAIPID